MLSTIASYELVSEDGQGATATVYRAWDPQRQQDVSIKLVRPEYLADPGFRKQFEQEAAVIAALSHPAIVPIYEFGEEDGRLYLVMAYMANGSLADRLAQGAVPLPAILPILKRIAEALDFAHENGIVHRDLKPANILFDEEDQAYLGDFGIALHAAVGGAGAEVITGTPYYMSPEQARRDAQAGGASDLYALAVTTFQMITGRLPFTGDSPVAIILQHLHEPAPGLQEVDPDLPASLDAVLGYALAKDPRARYPSAAAFVAAVEEALDHPEHIPSPPTDVDPAAETAPVGADTERIASRSVPDEARHAAPASESPTWQSQASAWLVSRPVTAFALTTALALLVAAIGVTLVTSSPDTMTVEPPGAAEQPGTVPTLASRDETDTNGDAAADAATTITEPEASSVQLNYDEARATLINAGTSPVDLRDLSFHRAGTDTQPAATFHAAEWRGVAGNVVYALPPGNCFQFVNLGAPGNPGPSEGGACADLRGWLGTSHIDRLFFIALAEESATFEVRHAGSLIQTCTIADGACTISLP